MREIKFRIWKKSISKMIYSGDANYLSKIKITLNGHIYEDDEWLTNDNMGEESIDAILMQFTGLQDKNGADICEGDIIQEILSDGTTLHELTIIKTNNFSISHCYDCEQECFGVGVKLDICNECNEIEIIGNIYEHPHLLEPKND